MLEPLANLVPPELAPIGRIHFQNLVNRVGPITEAEVDAQMARAAKIHADEWNRTAQPMDPMMPPEAHDWAVRHIAANLAARARGYDTERETYRPPMLPRRTEDADLRPSARTVGWTQR